MIQLRDYQRECIDQTYEWFRNNPTGNPLLVLPTAAGKSIIAGKFIQEIVSQWSDQRIMLLTHVKELIEQNYEKLMSLWPEAPAGIYSASFGRKDEDAQILFAGIQSVHKKAMHIGWVDLIFVDESHLIPKKTMSGMYRNFLDAMQKINPNLRIVGLTATPYRLDSGLLHEGDNRIFHDIAYEVPIDLLLERGFLSPLTTAPIKARLNTHGVKKRGGEFIKSELAKAVATQDDVTQQAVEEIIELGKSRKSWLVFCTSIEHAENVMEQIQASGVSVDIVTGKTAKRQREIILANFKAGVIRCLVNVDVLTTGFDAPNVDLLAILRPTQSLALYIQIMGRGMRIASGKLDCLVLDFAGNISRHGPIDAVNVPTLKGTGEGGIAPVKVCPNFKCKAELHTSAKECPECGYVFPSNPTHDAQASTLAIMSKDIEPDEYEITDVLYSRHKKIGSCDSLRVDYYAGFNRVVSEWVCIEHPGRAGSKARNWLARRVPDDLMPDLLPSYPPRTVDEILSFSERLNKPNKLFCKKAGKFTEIVGYSFE